MRAVHPTKTPIPVIKPEEQMDKWDHIERWLDENHPTRINAVTMRLEYFQDNKWLTMSDYQLNSIVRELRSKSYSKQVVDKNGDLVTKNVSMATTKSKLNDILESDFNPRVDVFKEYFEGLDIDSVSSDLPMISKLANSVKIKDSNSAEGTKPSILWPEYLKKWLVACVANFFDEYECQNQTMLVLVGGQNDGKTTWLNNLVPPSFNPQYRFCSGLPDPKGKDAMTLLVSMFLVNIDDQLGTITRKDADAIKNMITMPRVTIRLPYDKYTCDHPHRASLCGSLNYTGFLNDPTGNRRYLPFEIEQVDWSYLKKGDDGFVDIDEVWKEVYWLFLNAKSIGFSHKVSGSELDELNKHNNAFRTPTAEEDLINRWLDIPASYDTNSGNRVNVFDEEVVGQWFLTTTEVGDFLRNISQGHSHNSTKQLSLERIKRIMTSYGYIYKQRRMTNKATGNSFRPYVWSVLKMVDVDGEVDRSFGIKIESDKVFHK